MPRRWQRSGTHAVTFQGKMLKNIATDNGSEIQYTYKSILSTHTIVLHLLVNSTDSTRHIKRAKKQIMVRSARNKVVNLHGNSVMFFGTIAQKWPERRCHKTKQDNKYFKTIKSFV